MALMGLKVRPAERSIKTDFVQCHCYAYITIPAVSGEEAGGGALGGSNEARKISKVTPVSIKEVCF